MKFDHIAIWKPNEIPQELKGWLDDPNNPLGGYWRDDVDWVAYVPKKYVDEYMHWLDEPSFGCSHVDIVECPTGQIRVAHHS